MEREFKRLRPEFDIEREVNFICNQEVIEAPADENSKPKIFFNIFTKKPKVQPTIKTNPISKSKKKTAKSKPPGPKESLTRSAAQNNAQDIRKFMKIKKSPIKVAALQPVQLSIVSCEDQLVGGSEVRDRESGASNWDPGL